MCAPRLPFSYSFLSFLSVGSIYTHLFLTSIVLRHYFTVSNTVLLIFSTRYSNGTISISGTVRNTGVTLFLFLFMIKTKQK